MATAGYSGTPLAKKLGFKPGLRVAVLDSPPGYADWVAPLPADCRFVVRADAGADIVHAFVLEAATLERRLRDCRASLRPDAALWISWPKKSAKLPTDVTEDRIRALALPLGWVDIKVCAVSEIWSGLKLVVRKELR